MGDQEVVCEHKVRLAHGSCFGGGNLSYHGRCTVCGKDAMLTGRIDVEGNGKAQVTVFGSKSREIEVKEGNFIDL